MLRTGGPRVVHQPAGNQKPDQIPLQPKTEPVRAVQLRRLRRQPQQLPLGRDVQQSLSGYTLLHPIFASPGHNSFCFSAQSVREVEGKEPTHSDSVQEAHVHAQMRIFNRQLAASAVFGARRSLLVRDSARGAAEGHPDERQGAGMQLPAGACACFLRCRHR